MTKISLGTQAEEGWRLEEGWSLTLGSRNVGAFGGYEPGRWVVARKHLAGVRLWARGQVYLWSS